LVESGLLLRMEQSIKNSKAMRGDDFMLSPCGFRPLLSLEFVGFDRCILEGESKLPGSTRG
jgi:hypothetical protein